MLPLLMSAEVSIMPVTLSFAEAIVPGEIDMVGLLLMENKDDFHLQMGSHTSHYHGLTSWAVSRKKWDTKKDKST